jgi:hypothetical protein
MEDDSSLRDTKRSRKSLEAEADAPVFGNDGALSDDDDDEDEEAILRAAAAWSEKQTGSARVEPSELRKSVAKSWENEEEGCAMKITGSQESVMKLRLILEEQMVAVVATEPSCDADGNCTLMCEFPTRESYDALLGGSLFDDFAGKLTVEPFSAIKKRKRGEIQRGDSKRGSNRRAAIMMKPVGDDQGEAKSSLVKKIIG